MAAVTAASLLAAGIAVAVATIRGKQAQWLEENQQTLISGIKRYRTQDSLSAASIQMLRMTNSELEEYITCVDEECDQLNIKLQRVTQEARTATDTKAEIAMANRDTIYLTDTIVVRAKHFSWRDPWLEVDGLIEGDSTRCRIASRDTIVQIAHRIPRCHFLWWDIGTKAIRQEVMSKNPHTDITWSELIEVK